jgi:hypothetical protein
MKSMAWPKIKHLERTFLGKIPEMSFLGVGAVAYLFNKMSIN